MTELLHKRVVIFSDEPGWHGRQLKKHFAEFGFDSGFVSLSDCSICLDNASGKIEETLIIPGFKLNQLRGAFVRGVPGGTLEQVIQRLNILHALSELGTPVFNDGRAIERTVDKAMTSFLLKRHGLPTMDTWITESKATAAEIAGECIRKNGAVVAKPLFGSQGKGVVQINTMEEFERFQPVNDVYYLQSYVRPVGQTFRDWRVFVINGKTVGAMQRSSRHWVTNRAQGAECEPIQAEPGMTRLAEAAAAALNVDYAGVDLMRDVDGQWWVNEVNGIPAWQGLQRACKTNVTQLLVEAFLQKSDRSQTTVAIA
ncbi:MAG: RimK family alpha-L-glutamate ligase [Pseudomonadota bacterium]